MRTIGVLLAVGMFLGAGCVGSGESTVQTDAGSATASATPIDDTIVPGTIRGLVLTDELNPIKGATVGIQQPALQVETDESGAFAFEGLAPGPYAVAAQRLGYESFSKQATVVSGETIWLNFTLAPVEVAGAAYPESTRHTAQLECMLTTFVWVSSCSYPYTAVYLAAHENGVNLSNYGAPSDIMDNKWRYNYTIRNGAKAIVSEMFWTQVSDSAKLLNLRECRPDYDPVLDDCRSQYAAKAGASPINVAWAVPAGLKPKPGAVSWIMSCVWPAFPAATSPSQGIFLDQKIDMWNTVWYNGDPPEDWSVAPSV